MLVMVGKCISPDGVHDQRALKAVTMTSPIPFFVSIHAVVDRQHAHDNRVAEAGPAAQTSESVRDRCSRTPVTPNGFERLVFMKQRCVASHLREKRRLPSLSPLDILATRYFSLSKTTRAFNAFYGVQTLVIRCLAHRILAIVRLVSLNKLA